MTYREYIVVSIVGIVLAYLYPFLFCFSLIFTFGMIGIARLIGRNK